MDPLAILFGLVLAIPLGLVGYWTAITRRAIKDHLSAKASATAARRTKWSARIKVAGAVSVAAVILIAGLYSGHQPH